MGKSVTPKYRMELIGGELGQWGVWNSRKMGRPTEENIERHLVNLLDSCKPGGVNHHLCRPAVLSDGSEGCRLPHLPRKVAVIENRTNRVVAEWDQPMFMVV